jgi:CubicO group peptidase (beta-lactamase class C family)
MARYLVAVCLLVTSTLSAQVRQGPPPEIRALIDDTVAAVNSGKAEAWEAFAQKHYAPSLLQKQTPEARAKMYQQLADQFGTVTRGPVTRQGPEAPLEMTVKGTKGSGVIVLELEPGTPKIAGLRVTSGDRAEPAAGDAPRPPINGSMTSPEIEKNLDGYFTKLAADEVFSGVALVAKNGVPVFFKAYGLADREKKIANTTRTRFNLGSINKAFTQVAIHQLVAAGKLSYSDTLGQFYPDYPQAASRAATVEQLLSHRAGLADFFGPDFDRAPKGQFASNADYFKYVSSRPPTFAPGEREQYCNGCYIALGAIVEKASGMPYEKYVADNVFRRAEMTSTGYPRSDQPAADIAIGYTRRGGTEPPKTPGPQDLRNNVALHGVTGSAAGGGYSTALDLLTYVKAVGAGKFPNANPEMGIAGGAPGINAVIETRGEWVVIVLANLDPPAAQSPGAAIAGALAR